MIFCHGSAEPYGNESKRFAGRGRRPKAWRTEARQTISFSIYAGRNRKKERLGMTQKIDRDLLLTPANGPYRNPSLVQCIIPLPRKRVTSDEVPCDRANPFRSEKTCDVVSLAQIPRYSVIRPATMYDGTASDNDEDEFHSLTSVSSPRKWTLTFHSAVAGRSLEKCSEDSSRNATEEARFLPARLMTETKMAKTVGS